MMEESSGDDAAGGGDGSSSGMDESGGLIVGGTIHNDGNDDNVLTEPIMDASFLDDEINTVNDEFSSWKLTLHNNHHIQRYHTGGLNLLSISSGETDLDELSSATRLLYPQSSNLNNLNNNNNLLQQSSEDLQHCETIASITGSILDQLDFDSFFMSTAAASASAAISTASFSSSQRTPLPLLFSPTREESSSVAAAAAIASDAAATTVAGMSTYSTDSLDKSLLLDKLTRCMNHDDQATNYTIAFPDCSSTTTTTTNASSCCHQQTYKNLLTQSCPGWRITSGGGGGRSGSGGSGSNDSSLDKKNNNMRRLAEILTKTKEIQTSNDPLQQQQQQQQRQKLIVCYPNYVLPDLQFLQKNNNQKSSSVAAAAGGYVLNPKEFKSPSHKSSSSAASAAAAACAAASSRRPLSLNDVDMLKVRKEKVADWESLEFLLPQKFKTLINTIDKPLEEREKNDPNEKEQDESSGSEGGATTNKVKYRDCPGKGSSRKRYSMGCDSTKNKNRHKRFSLQEIEEITEMTRDIDSALLQFSKLHLQQQQQQPHPPTNTPTSLSGSSQKHHHNCSGGGNNSLMEEKAGLCGQVTWAVTLLSRGVVPVSKGITSVSRDGKQVVELLCPALYSLLSDGLLPHIDTIFGRVPNTLWRVVEASIQTGPTSQSLSELVLRINSEEDLMPEGPIKFNAFIVGLLNLRSLSSWLTFLRTKDRLLRVHYAPGSLMYVCNTVCRSLYDQMLANTLVLSKLNYTLDIFHETKMLLHKIPPRQPTNKKIFSAMKRSFSDERPKRVSKHSQNYHHSSNLPKSKTTQILNKPQMLNKYFPSQQLLPTQQQEMKTVDKFKKLQLQWEMLASNREESPTATTVAATTAAATVGTPSRIPRPISMVTSPVSTHPPPPMNVRPSSAFPHHNRSNK